MYIFFFVVMNIELLWHSNSFAKIHEENAIKKAIEESAKDFNGYILMKGEKEKIEESGGAPTYGEITFEGAEYLLQDLKLQNTDIVYDLGSGSGKFIFQAHLTTPAKKVVGIEISQTRHCYACLTYKNLYKKGLIDQERVIKFQLDDITNADFSDATFIYLCSVCFSDDLMQKITQKIVQLPSGVRIASFKQLPLHRRLSLQCIYRVPVNWNPRALIFLYKLQ